LREVEKRIGIVRQFAACFLDYRNPDLIEHTVEELVAQRVYGLALGYEDLNDHEELRKDPLLAVLVEKSDLAGEVLAGKSTLNRLELTPATATAKARYKKIVADHAAVDRLFVDVFLAAHRQAPQQIILDLDATDDPLHGNQEGRFFHGYYGHYCYLPLYIFCGEFLLGARLRPSNIDASAGSVEELKRIVKQIRAVWPEVRILVRADSVFCREELMACCEAEGVDYLLGLAKNERLKAQIEKESQQAKRALEQVQEWTVSAGLQLHPQKTRIVDASQAGGFDFLGYHFERGLRWPRAKSLRKFNDTVRAKTQRRNGHSLEAIIVDLNRTLKGWFEYFKHSHKSKFPRLDQWVRMRLRSILRRRHHRRGQGRGWDHRRWPNAFFAEHGLFSLTAAHAQIRQSSRR